MSKRYLHDVKLIPRPAKPFKKIGLSFVILILCAGLISGGYLLSNFLTGGGLSWISGNKIKVNGLNYYVIYFGEYDDKESATDCIFWTASGGGASYVHKLSKYIVCGQLYNNFDDVNLVMENFGEDLTYSPKFMNVKTDKKYIGVDGVTALDKKTITAYLNTTPKIIDEVLNISNRLDKNQISRVSAGSEINSLKSQMKITTLELASINLNYNSGELNKFINFSNTIYPK